MDMQDAMTSEEVWTFVVSGEMTCEEFKIWVDDQTSRAWSEGFDVGQTEGY